jgi:derlin-1
MMLLYRYSVSLETTIYEGRRADYVFFLLFCAVFLLASTAILPSVILGTGLLSSLLYLWSRKNPDLVLSFMFGLRFKAIYLPWVLCGFKLLQGGSPLIELIGIVVGHLWYFVTDLYPLQSGRQILKTPAILYNWFPSPYAPQQAQNNNPNAPAAARHAWGQGHRLN